MATEKLKTEAINLLTTLGEGVKFVPLSQYHESAVASGRILKARKRFVELLDECKMEYSPIVGPAPAKDGEDLVTPSGSYMYHLSSCYALFQYLTVSSQAARVVFQDVLSFLDKVPTNSNPNEISVLSSQKELDSELVTVAEIQLLSFHTGVSPVPLTDLRSGLQKALSKYPSNAALLEVFLQTERKCHVIGRLRRYFHHLIENTQSPVPIFFAILSELRRQESIKEATNDRSMTSTTPEGNFVLAETGISHQIRSLFERAVRSRYTRHCILFWRMYIQFEVSAPSRCMKAATLSNPLKTQSSGMNHRQDRVLKCT
ncbi:hypothetical protein BSL78_07934 [Apostichopus japonicus]|uniref:Uncharacterized protein n=1 Tax=Stichopus japonicus TaxID=307972 RepID=A0A2G8L4L1_STIJA|nr:hypothetical protein BSL78_07934 [Apostichopus japonicus]